MVEFPSNVYLLAKDDGSFAVYTSEQAIAAPVDKFTELATYQLVKQEQVQRQIIFAHRPIPPTP